MKLFVATILFVAVAADRLENTYLPPSSSKTAGGNGNFLSAPFGQGNRTPSGQYGSPAGSSGRLSPPSTSYGVPASSFGAGSRTPSSNYGAPVKSAFSNFGASSGSSKFGLPSKPAFSNFGAPARFPSSTFSSSTFGKTPASTFGSPSTQFGGPSAQYGSPAAKYGVPSTSYGSPGAYSGAQSAEARAATIRFNNENNGDGSYRFEFATENKIMQQEAGQLKNVGTQQEGSVVQGSYSYLGNDGASYTVNYVADENGFQPSGAHIPTPPPVPAAIQKSLQRNAALGGTQGYPSASQGSYNQGSYKKTQGGFGGQQGGFGGQQGGFGGQQGGFAGKQGAFAGKQGGFGGQQGGFGGQQSGFGGKQGGFSGQQGGFGGQQGGFGGKQGGFGSQQGGFGGQQKFPGSGFGAGAGRPSAGAASRQYLAPNKPSFNPQTGYQY